MEETHGVLLHMVSLTVLCFQRTETDSPTELEHQSSWGQWMMIVVGFEMDRSKGPSKRNCLEGKQMSPCHRLRGC